MNLTPDQQDTRDYLERVAQYFDKSARLEQARGSDRNGVAHFRYSFGQYVSIHANGKPAHDGERA